MVAAQTPPKEIPHTATNSASIAKLERFFKFWVSIFYRWCFINN